MNNIIIILQYASMCTAHSDFADEVQLYAVMAASKVTQICYLNGLNCSYGTVGTPVQAHSQLLSLL